MCKVLRFISLAFLVFVPVDAIACQNQLLDKSEAAQGSPSLNYGVMSGVKERVISHANQAQTSSVQTIGERIGCEFISAKLNRYTNAMLVSHVLDLELGGVRQSAVDSIAFGVARYSEALIAANRSDEAMDIAELILQLDERGKKYWEGYQNAASQLGISNEINFRSVQVSVRNKNLETFQAQITQIEQISSKIRSHKLDEIIGSNFNLFSLEYWFTALEDNAQEALRAIEEHGEIDRVFLSYNKSEQPVVRDVILDRTATTLMQFKIWSAYELAAARFEGREPSSASSYKVVCHFPTDVLFDVSQMGKPNFQKGYDSGQVSNDIKFSAEFLDYSERTLLLACENPVMD